MADTTATPDKKGKPKNRNALGGNAMLAKPDDRKSRRGAGIQGLIANPDDRG